MKNPKTKRKRITNLDSKIFVDIIKAKRPLSIKQIAQRLGITWPTTKKHIEKLQKLNVLENDKTIRKNRIKIKPDFIAYLREKKYIREVKSKENSK